MKLFAPWALWFLGSIPLIIMMYILKQKFEEREISSVYLWQQVLKDIEVNTPWQKLKKNLLLLLQLLAALLLVLALSDPFVTLKGTDYSNLIVVIDNTGSMNAVYDGGTRLQKAKDLAEVLIKNAATGTQITVISSGRQPKVELSNTTDKQEALRKVNAIRTTNSSGDINDAISLVKALSKQALTYKAVFYTDGGVNLEDINGELVSVSKPVDNLSLDMLSHTLKDGKLKMLVRITNHSSTEAAREITIYGNENVLDIKTVELKPGETKSVMSEAVVNEVTYIWAEINGSDGLESDNVVYDIVKPSKLQKVMLVSQSNLFIEKAFSIIENVELYKSNPGDEIEGEYDLYIYDGNMPSKLPSKGSIMLINPPAGNEIVSVAGEIEGGRAKAEQHLLTKFIENTSFGVSKLKSIELPYWADELLDVEGSPAAFTGQYRDRKVAVLSFDLHNSDFVLTSEYPIFMHNLAGYLINISTGEKSAYQSGEAVNLNPVPDAVSAFVENPSKKVQDIELKYPILPFENTEEVGIYRLVQKLEKEELQSLFAVNFPSDTESNTLAQQVSSDGTTDDGKAFITGRRIAAWLLVLVLLLAFLEWVVYIHGY
ncbi:MAG: N-terminal double-transrane protein [Clostridia bacterium]|jgi:hypothetical protein|nr:N-terminal double-transrane protein [Clostridia bacterium]